MKKIISILLALVLVASVAVVSANAFSAFDEEAEHLKDAIAAYEAETGDEVPTYRYYFQIPDGNNGPTKQVDDEVGSVGDHAKSWINEYNEGYCSIYYWATGSFPTQDTWTGYVAEKLEGVPNVYYADVPQKVLTIIWNNGVDGGTDVENPLFFYRAQTKNLKVEYLDPGEWEEFPDGLASFDNMIYIVNPDDMSVEEYSGAQTCGGRWYYYLEDGCYTDTPEGACVNPDHYDANGNHVGYQEPTEPGPEKLLGDVDGDGVVSVIDATQIQKYKAQILTENDIDLSVADVDGDGVVSVLDASRIQKYKAKIMNLDGTTPYVEES